MTTEFRPDKNGYPTPAELKWRQEVHRAGRPSDDYFDKDTTPPPVTTQQEGNPMSLVGTITNFREIPVVQG